MKYSFIIPYFKRAQLLRATLLSYAHFYSERKDWEIILMEDGESARDAKEHGDLLALLRQFPDFCVRHIVAREKNQINPCRLRNLAAKTASGQYLVLTNPESAHRCDVLGGFDQELNAEDSDSPYVICACENAALQNITAKTFAEFRFAHIQWYCHSVYNNRKLHFCSAIAKNLYEAIGGFDEAYAQWIGYDDDDFRQTVIASGVQIKLRDDLLVSHIDHPRGYLPPDKDAKLAKALFYYNAKWK